MMSPARFSRRTLLRAGGACSALLVGRALAAAPAAPAAPVATVSDAVLLTPFTVTTEKDGGYEATNTNALTGTRTAIKNVPITMEVMNQQFFDDLGLTNTVDALREFTAGVGPPVRGAGNAPDGEGSLRGDNYGPNNFTIRGFGTGNPRADGVVTGETLLFDQFSVERTELIRGPQTLLYGSASPSGVVNLVSKQAVFGRNTYQGRVRLDDEGSWRAELDTNQSLGRYAALRLAAVKDETRYWRDNLKDADKGLYGQLAVRPLSRLTLRLQGEHLFQHSIQSMGGVLLNDPTSPDNNTRLHLLIADGRAGNLVNGKLGWNNADSLYGDGKTRDKTADYILASAELRIAEWLNARFTFADADWDDWDRQAQAGSNLLPPTRTPLNPTGKWAFGYRPFYTAFGQGERSFRAQFAADFALWRKKIKNSFLFGGEDRTATVNFSNYDFYQLDAAGNFVVNRANIANAQSGRTQMPVQYYSVEDGLDGLPIDRREFVINGVTYRVAPRQLVGAVPATPTNPYGLSSGPNGLQLTKAHSRAAFGSLFSDWFDGKFNTLAGVRYDQFQQDILQNGTFIRTHALTWNVGAVYHLNDFLSPYVGLSSNYAPHSQFSSLLDGSPIPDSRGRGKEAGVKFDLPRLNLSGSLAFYNVTSANEALALTADLQNAVDPNGLNGRLRPIGLSVLRERRIDGYELSATARPSRDWRIRFSFAHLKSVGSSSIVLPQFYNDEFFTSASGGVLYNDRTPALVPATPGNAASGLVPLTVAMLRDPASPYFANLDPTSGRILNLRAGTLDSVGLTNRTDGRTIGTGRTGLPIAQHQLGFVSPVPAGVVVQRPGETSTGFPANSISTSAVYTVNSEGFLRGVSLGLTVVARTDVQGYFYNDALTGQRVLKRLPDQLLSNILLGYGRKIGRCHWSTQLNLNNAFDRVSVVHLPDVGTGRIIDARLDANPRSIIWTNTVRF